MSATHQRLMRIAALTDCSCEQVAGALRVRCLHCRSWLTVAQDGRTTSAVTLEHVVPQSWFLKPRAIKLLFEGLREPAPESANDPRNLALACAGCNQAKGRSHDRTPFAERAQAVVRALWQTRMGRYQAVSLQANAPY